jgi:hypothetical protein
VTTTFFAPSTVAAPVTTFSTPAFMPVTTPVISRRPVFLVP